MSRGGSLQGYHSPQVDVDVRLNTNESPYPPPAAFLDALADEVRCIAWHRYPDREARALREAIGAFHGVGADQVFCANGSNEVIQCLLLACGGPARPVALFDPTYQLHAHIADITGTPVLAFTRRADFGLDEAELAAACADGPSVIFTCSPNNPTGTLDDPAQVEALADRAPGLVLVDEAYGQFSPSSAVPLAVRSGKLAVCRTFSKVWSLAALRLGYLIGSESLVSGLEQVALPYHLSAFTQAAGLTALRFPDEMHERVTALTLERERLYATLSKRGDVEVWPSGANFVLFRPHSRDGHQVWRLLLDRSVLVRDFSSRKGIEGCLRVTVGTPEENDRFFQALDEALGATV